MREKRSELSQQAIAARARWGKPGSRRRKEAAEKQSAAMRAAWERGKKARAA